MMSTVFRWCNAPLAAFLVVTLALSADAIVVRHNGTEIARTSYDDLDIGNASSNSPAPPAGFVGFADTGGGRNLQINNTANTGIPALSGNQFAHCGSGENGQCKTGLVFASPPITSGVIEVEWGLYKPTGTGRVGFGLSGDTDVSGPSKRAQGEIGFVAIAGIDNEYDVDVRTPGVTDANVDINLDAWNNMLLRYDFVDDNATGDRTNDTWTLFVNGVEQTGAALSNLNNSSGIIGIDRFGFESTATNANWAVDVVPEPSAAILLMTAAIGGLFPRATRRFNFHRHG